mmetsp:Transcript_48631/g.135888  ORF Transcript_48631/g.135888 Transcript_48631/m.135888 type:complete len:441 (-) Transcript_48631:1323-2645(-)
MHRRTRPLPLMTEDLRPTPVQTVWISRATGWLSCRKAARHHISDAGRWLSGSSFRETRGLHQRLAYIGGDEPSLVSPPRHRPAWHRTSGAWHKRSGSSSPVVGHHLPTARRTYNAALAPGSPLRRTPALHHASDARCRRNGSSPAVEGLCLSHPRTCAIFFATPLSCRKPARHRASDALAAHRKTGSPPPATVEFRTSPARAARISPAPGSPLHHKLAGRFAVAAISPTPEDPRPCHHQTEGTDLALDWMMSPRPASRDAFDVKVEHPRNGSPSLVTGELRPTLAQAEEIPPAPGSPFCHMPAGHWLSDERHSGTNFSPLAARRRPSPASTCGAPLAQARCLRRKPADASGARAVHLGMGFLPATEDLRPQLARTDKISHTPDSPQHRRPDGNDSSDALIADLVQKPVAVGLGHIVMNPPFCRFRHLPRQQPSGLVRPNP